MTTRGQSMSALEDAHTHGGETVEAALPDALDGVPLFACLTPQQRRQLADMASVRRVKPGEKIVAQESTPTALFVVVSGEVEISRGADDAAERHQIRRLGPGETFGELALLEDLPTSASVYATLPTTLLAVPLVQLRRIMSRDASFQPLFHGLAQQLNTRLRTLTDVTVGALEREVEALHARITVGTLLIATVALLSGFTFSLSVGVQLARAGGQQMIVLLISTVGVVGMGLVVRHSHLPLSFWGLTVQRWRPAIRDALFYSLIFFGLMLAIKWALIHTLPSWRDLPLLYRSPLGASAGGAGLGPYLAQLGIYVLIVVPLQEFIVRGCIQGGLQEFLTGRHRVLWAIITSNLFFSVTHSYLSSQFALLTLLPGLFWGWLYYRERTLIGPMLSHALIGVAGIDVVGILDLMK